MNSFMILLNKRKELCREITKIDSLIEEETEKVDGFFYDLRETVEDMQSNWNSRLTALLDNTSEIDDQEFDQFTELVKDIKLLQDRLLSYSD